jgi:uncharacterized protein Smg (DUF494 family)
VDGVATDAEQLGQQLLELGIAAGDIEPVLEKIRALAQAQNELKQAASSKLHDQALSALMELEFKLRQQLGTSRYPQLLISDSTEVADDYKAMVADYFRELSRP